MFDFAIESKLSIETIIDHSAQQCACNRGKNRSDKEPLNKYDQNAKMSNGRATSNQKKSRQLRQIRVMHRQDSVPSEQFHRVNH